MRFMLIVAAIVIFSYWAVGRATDQELGTAQAGNQTIVKHEQYQGLTLREWAGRAVANRKVINKQKREIRRLTNAQRRESAHFFDWMAAAACVISKEGAWTTNTGNGYYGALQADLGFQRAYGSEHYRRWGTANNWPWWAQLEMGYRGWLFRGWQPWPATSRACGLR